MKSVERTPGLSQVFFCIVVCVTPLVTLTGCRTAGDNTFSLATLRRAIVVKGDVDQAIAVEKALDENTLNFAPEGTPWFAVKKGNSRVLVSAPHATHPTRHGELRGYADPGSGSLAEMLHRLADVTVIYTTYASPSDPNYYDDNDYKRALAQLLDEEKPIIVLDLHVSSSNRPYDVDIGTMYGASLHGAEDFVSRLLAILQEEGMRNFSSNYFAAFIPNSDKPETVTKFVSARGVPCVQLEFNSTWTRAGDSAANAHRFAQLLQGMVRFIKEVDAAEK